MKKKFMVLALAVTLMCSLVGCSMPEGTVMFSVRNVCRKKLLRHRRKEMHGKILLA